MNDYELRRALFEYDIAITNVRQTDALGFEIQLALYVSICEKRKHKDTDKANVMFQTDFLEETYCDFLYNNKDSKLTGEKLEKWHSNLLNNNSTAIDWDLVILSANPNNLQEILTLHSNNMTHEVYWKTIGHCYTSSNLAHSKKGVILHYLNSDRPNKHFLMNENERRFLNDLPEQVTIYRGCSQAEIKSNKLRFSWTLDRKIAQFFANEYRNGVNDKKTSKYEVIERAINKNEIIAYFGDREESEILYFPKN
jgi:hypothetical protein